ncbi:MAG: bifunctional methylenetetrahydrofolate dehydrogenase/methenyltetrahydrofolate cyclohydrolase FolD [Candidatus Limivicinus sp.]|jgi:methylenetetrahydrofolate dehydrogenase (NADP+)/methenyltetrahydrofolate cyclohydrolase
MATILDGKALAAKVRREVAEEAEKLPRVPGLAVILVGDDPASRIYVTGKRKDCRECGFMSREYKYDAGISEAELLELIEKLNRDDEIDGILVQLPLPENICEAHVIEAISPEKDVDAFHPVNVGHIASGEPGLLPCTPAGIMELLAAYDISVAGKLCVIVGRSSIVGKPMCMMMLNADGTVVCCHRKTRDLAALTRQADILVVAAGHKKLITADMVKSGAVVIDVAMNRDKVTGKLSGDADFENLLDKVSYISPVPGGVGPMTRAMLMKNILTAARMHQGLK